jgi:hypothetical protein
MASTFIRFFGDDKGVSPDCFILDFRSDSLIFPVYSKTITSPFLTSESVAAKISISGNSYWLIRASIALKLSISPPVWRSLSNEQLRSRSHHHQGGLYRLFCTNVDLTEQRLPRPFFLDRRDIPALVAYHQ